MDEAILGCITATWTPGASGIAGWLGFVPHALVGVLCLRAVRPGAPDQNFWLSIGMALLAVALAKPFDLPLLVTAAGRCVALAEGWYDARRPIQAALVVAVGAAVLILGLAAVGMLHRSLSRVWPALLGLALLASYVGIRVIDLHRIDALMQARIGPMPVSWLAEYSGLALIGANAVVRRSRSLRRRRDREQARAHVRAFAAASGPGRLATGAPGDAGVGYRQPS